jgi:hypothetical protein
VPARLVFAQGESTNATQKQRAKPKETNLGTKTRWRRETALHFFNPSIQSQASTFLLSSSCLEMYYEHCLPGPAMHPK